jgi:hypothetical protein
MLSFKGEDSFTRPNSKPRYHALSALINSLPDIHAIHTTSTLHSCLESMSSTRQQSRTNRAVVTTDRCNILQATFRFLDYSKLLRKVNEMMQATQYEGLYIT